MTSTAPETNALADQIGKITTTTSDGYWEKSKARTAVLKALRTLTAERDSLAEHQINQPQLDSMAELLSTLTAENERLKRQIAEFIHEENHGEPYPPGAG